MVRTIEIENRTDKANSARLVAFYQQLITLTNIGTAFVNIFPGAKGQRQIVDFRGFKEYRLIVHWGVIGTGVQNIRIIDDTDPLTILAELSTSVAGEKELDSGWTSINYFDPEAPAGNTWQDAEVFIRLQAKSTVGTDDPVFRKAALLLR